MRTNLRNIFSLTLVAAAVAACGGGGGDSGSNNGGNGGTQQPQTVSGKAIDFYLSGATVTFTDCGNQTATTNATGDFTFPAGCTSSALTVTGGVDIGTKLPFSGVLKAPATAAGSTPVVTPLTTLIAVLGPAKAEALAAKLGLTGQNLLTTDPMENAALLKASVVVQQLLDQVSETLVALSQSTGGTLTPEQAASAAAAALASKIDTASGTFDLKSVSNVTNVVASAVTGAASGGAIPLSGASLDAAANNVAALTAATIAKKVTDVDTAMTGVTIRGNATATLQAINTARIGANKESPATANLISTVGSTVLTNPNATASLSNLGTAVSNGVGIANAAAQVDAVTGGNLASKADDLASAEVFKNFLQLGNVTLVGTSPAVYDIKTVYASTGANSPLSVIGSLTSVQMTMAKGGSPFGNAAQIKTALSYTVGGNTVTVVIDRIDLTFSGNALTAATVPAGASISYTLSGAATLTGALNNNAPNTISSSTGDLSLPVASVLAKVKAAGILSDAQVAAYTPKTGDIVTVSAALSALTGAPVVKVGIGTGDAAKAASRVNVGGVNGYGVKGAKVVIN